MQIRMSQKELTIAVEKRLEAVREVLQKKAAEYATDSDRMHNFNCAAIIMGKSPVQAAWNFAIKHLVSIVDLIESDLQRVNASEDMIKEKFGDLINYLILIEAMILQEKKLIDEHRMD